MWEDRMKRVGNLWDRLVSFPNLLGAARKARKGKRSRFDVQAFEFDAERAAFASAAISSHSHSDCLLDQLIRHLEQQLSPTKRDGLGQRSGVCEHPADRPLGPGVEPDGPG